MLPEFAVRGIQFPAKGNTDRAGRQMNATGPEDGSQSRNI
jgi:hypothetical protein